MYFYGADNRYLYTADDHSYSIIDRYSVDAGHNAVLWSHPKDDSTVFPCGEPCLVYMGEKSGLPMFFDCTNGRYIFPHGEGKLDVVPGELNVIKPIIVNGQNIVNVIDDAEFIHVSMLEQCFDPDTDDSGDFSGEFDQVTVEIKVTLKGKNGTQERCYPVPDGIFAPGDVASFETW